MNINLAFSLCQAAEGDRLLKRVLSAAISLLYRHLPRSAITDIQIAGSLAHGEGTVITTDSGFLSSDVDLIISLRFPYYLISVAHRLDERLSEMATSVANSMGVKTHVTFTSDVYGLHMARKVLRRSSIYDYEFIFNRSLLRAPVNKRAQLPTYEDALQLVYTSVAEYVTLYQGFTSHLERLYWLTKRILTLIYSGLIFERRPKLSYAERVRTALQVLPIEILSADDANIIESCLVFKITGDVAAISGISGSKDLDKSVMILESKWLHMVTRILRHELRILFSDRGVGTRNRDLEDLLNLHFTRSKKSVPGIISYTLQLLLVSVMTRRSSIIRLVGTAWRSKHTLTSIANYLAALELTIRLGSGRARGIENSLMRLWDLSPKPSTIAELWVASDGLRYIV